MAAVRTATTVAAMDPASAAVQAASPSRDAVLTTHFKAKYSCTSDGQRLRYVPSAAWPQPTGTICPACDTYSNTRCTFCNDPAADPEHVKAYAMLVDAWLAVDVACQ